MPYHVTNQDLAPLTRGIFRIPGNKTTVDAIYDHYAIEEEQDDTINDTVRCPVLPEHIRYNVHDVASAFKRFLSGLPDGILGSGWLLDAFISIHTLLGGDCDLIKTKQAKLRARLIALAIAAIPSRFQREFICAVIGLLSMIGRAAEIARREDERGRLLLTSSLMGYEPLGVVFGPLLAGKLIERHGIRYPQHLGRDGYLHTEGQGPSKSWKGYPKQTKLAEEVLSMRWHADQIRLASNVTEMLITQWRDVVRQMKSLGSLKSIGPQLSLTRPWNTIKPSASATNLSGEQTQCDHRWETTPPNRNNSIHIEKKRKSTPLRSSSNQPLHGSRIVDILTPTAEENPYYEHQISQRVNRQKETPTRQASRNRLNLGQGATFLAESNLAIEGESPERQSPPVTITRSSPEGTLRDPALPNQPTPTANKNKSNSIPNANLSIGGADGAQSLLEQHQARQRNTIRRSALRGRPQTSAAGSPSSRRLLEESLVFSKREHGDKHDIPSISSAEIPKGIVAQRLRGIAASEPGYQSQNFQRTPLSSAHGGMGRPKPTLTPKNAMPSTDGSHRSQNLRKTEFASQESPLRDFGSKDRSQDPVTRYRQTISRAPEVAVDGGNTDSSRYSAEVSEDNSMSISPGNDSRASGSARPPLETAQLYATPRNKLLQMPPKHATDSRLLRRGGSVKELAARFNETRANAILSSSPTVDRVYKSSLDGRTALFQPIATSPYISNSTVKSLRPIKSQTSLRNSDNRISLSPKRHLSPVVSRYRMTEASLMPKPLTPRRRMNPTSSDRWTDESSVAVEQFPLLQSNRGSSPFRPVVEQSPRERQLSFAERKYGDSYSQKLLQEVISDVQNIGHPHPSSTSLFSTATATRSSGSAIAAANTNVIHNSNDDTLENMKSMYSSLYDQIQELQTQLDGKNDEINALNQHLRTEGNASDIHILIQELQQVTRELGMWRNRAATAESRLAEATSLLPAADLYQIFARHPAHTGTVIDEQHIQSSTEESHTLDEPSDFASRGGLNPGMDGTAYEAIALESEDEGTVRRNDGHKRRAKRRHLVSYDGMYDYDEDEDKENMPPPRQMEIDPAREPYELE